MPGGSAERPARIGRDTLFAMARIKDEAICIWLQDWSETSQVAVFLTETGGKLRGLAKGARRMSPGAVARYSGGIELLARGQVVASTGRPESLAVVTEWDLHDPHPHLRQELVAHRLGLYAADVVGHLMAEGDPHPAVFRALAEFLAALAGARGRAGALLRFQWAILEELGYRPELDQDPETGLPLPLDAAAGTLVFDPGAGGGRVARPGAGETGAAGPGPWPVRSATLELLRRVRDGTLPARPESAVLDRANRLLCVYIRSILGRELMTMRVVLEGA